MRAAGAGLAVWALIAAPASAVPVRAGDIPATGIANGGNGVVAGIDRPGKVVAIVASDADVSGGGGAASARAGERQHAQGARKRRCLWRKRECYPPANLWYRVTVEFDGQLTFRARDHFQSCPACWVMTTEVKWRIASNTAVRLRLLCDDEDDDTGPFLVKRRIDGKRRPIGGCARGARGDVHPSLLFAAHAAGELTRWTNTAVVDPVDGQIVRCEGFTHTTTTSGQPLSGAIRTTGGSLAALEIDVSPIGPVMPPTSAPPTHTCTNKITGEVTTHYGSPAGGGACCYLWGSTGWYQHDDVFGWRTISQKLRFSPRAANFGRRYAPVLEATQREITEPRPEPLPPPGAAWARQEQSYHYKIVLEPCPDRGLDVERC